MTKCLLVSTKTHSTDFDTRNSSQADNFFLMTNGLCLSSVRICFLLLNSHCCFPASSVVHASFHNYSICFKGSKCLRTKLTSIPHPELPVLFIH